MKTCDKCGSTNITSTKKMQKTCAPKKANVNRLMPPKKITYGRVYYKHICECGHTWEEETHL